MQRSVTIIVPVYGDWPSLSDCIESLKRYTDKSNTRIILANDRGPEWKLIEDNILGAIKGYGNFKYVLNPENLGFIGNCNRAVFEIDQSDNDILLLNSDTKVTEGFIEEMSTVLHSDDKNGTVSPRSNNATITTVPLRAASQKGIDQDASYEIFKKISRFFERSVEVPVAHGFCMLIRRECIDQFGLFDPAFGKGYGEEVDFCQRIRKEGYKCLIANHAYVYHQEAKSFSLETKSKLLEDNNKIIWKRYPKYRQEVRDYMTRRVAEEDDIEAKALGREVTFTTAIKNHLKKYKLLRSVARRIKR